MFKHVILAAAAFAVAVPAGAVTTVITQTKRTGFADIGLGPISASERFRGFDFFGLTNQRLVSVTLLFEGDLNARVRATNNATGGNAPSRRRDVSATTTLTASATGAGFNLQATDSQTDSRTGIAGNGNVVTLGAIDPLFSVQSTLTSGLGAFQNGNVFIQVDASALVTTAPANNVVYSAPEFLGGSSLLTLTYESVVPEPASWALLITGFGLLGAQLRRRRAATVAA